MPAKAKSAKVATKGRTWSHELDVTGLRFRFTRDGRNVLAGMVAKSDITGIKLEREPENEHDENAIKVCLPDRILDGKHIGYIRRTAAALIAPKLDDGSLVVVSAKLIELYKEDDWNEGSLLIVFRDVPSPAKKTPRRKDAKRAGTSAKCNAVKGGKR